MARLLVSVRNASEAQAALAGGADLIDVKEPARGALGAADRTTIAEIAACVADRRPMSVALGEATENNRLDAALADSIRYAKFGLAGCRREPGWHDCWRRAVQSLPAGVIPVAVAYADWQAAAAPDPDVTLSLGLELGCGALLVDTFDKSGGPLVNHMALSDLRRLLNEARGAGLATVAAGGLGLRQLDAVLSLDVDYVGVRGAACRAGRCSPIDPVLVRELVDAVHHGIAPGAASSRSLLRR